MSLHNLFAGNRADGPAEASVLIEAVAGFAAEAACSNIFLQQRAGDIFRIAEAFVQHFENVHADVEADQVWSTEWAHRVIHAQLHQCGVYALQAWRRLPSRHNAASLIIGISTRFEGRSPARRLHQPRLFPSFSQSAMVV